METFSYNLDSQSLEIFPKHISENTYIIYHGTIEHYSGGIEQNGFQIGTSAYNAKHGLELVEMLKRPEFASFDKEEDFIFFKRTLAQNIEEYLSGHDSRDSRLSFAVLSSACLPFTTPQMKGGQARSAIRKAKKLIEQALEAKPEFADLIPENVQALFDETDAITSSNGVVYAVEMPKDLAGLEINQHDGIIWSNKSIPVSNIVGKIVVPNDAIVPERNAIQNKTRAKQMRVGMIPNLVRKQAAEERENS